MIIIGVKRFHNGAFVFIGRLVLFLVSEAADYITGEVIVADGGFQLT